MSAVQRPRATYYPILNATGSGTYFNGADYIIYRIGNTYFAKNTHTGNIDSSGPVASTVIQYACDHMPTLDYQYNEGHMAIGVKPGGVIAFMFNDYSITTKITVPAGVKIYGNGSRMECSSLNDTCFSFNDAGVEIWLWGAITGIDGFFFHGNDDNSKNLNGKCAYFNNIPYTVSVTHCAALRMNNGVTIDNSTWLTWIEGFHLQSFRGIGIELKSSATDSTANGSHIIDCDIEGADVASAIGVSAIGPATHPLEEIKIQGCWFEQVPNGIKLCGYRCTIDGNRISGHSSLAGGTLINILQAGGNNGQENMITNNGIFSAGLEVALIDIQTTYETTSIFNNYFKNSGAGPSIRSTTENYLLINGNHFVGAGTCISVKGAYLVADGNMFGSVTTGIEILGNDTFQTITGNTFFSCTNGIMNARYAVISDNNFTTVNGGVLISATNASSVCNNVFTSCNSSISVTSGVFSNNTFDGFTGSLTLTSSTVNGNLGYVNKLSGTIQFTAATTVVVTHGMVTTPTKVVATGSDVNSASLWVTNIGATQFTINRGNSTGTPWVYWYAEV